MKNKNKNLKYFLNKRFYIRPIFGRFFSRKNWRVLYDNLGIFCHKLYIAIIVLGFFASLSFPQHSLAYTFPEINHLPEIRNKAPSKIVDLYITAYNSLIWQTNFQPCITASGLNVCERDIEDIIATNYSYLPFGSKIKIPELFGDREFVVEDRMNQRFTRTLDVWMKSYADAREFGRKQVKVEIYPAGR